MAHDDDRSDGSPRPARRLLALNHFANPRHVPGGTRLVELCERLDGWDATVVAADRNLFTQRRQRGGDTSFRTVPTPPYGGNDATRIANWAVYALGAFLVGLRGPRPDVVLASSPHLLTGLAGWGVARLRRARFVLEIRDLWPQILVDAGRMRRSSPLYRAVRALELFLYARADAVVVLAPGVAEAIAACGVPPARIHLVPNAADPADFAGTAPRDELRRRFGFTGVTVVYSGAHGPANGLDQLLDAAAEVRRDLPEVRVVLVGDGLERAHLLARAAREGLDNVTFLQPVPKDEMCELLAAADAGVHVLADIPLFRYGVSPNKLFDYMAAGLPVLTNTGGDVGALVTEHDAGVAVTPDGLASGIRTLVAAGAAGRAAWGANGRAFVAEHQSRASTAARLAAVLDEVTV